ncbi:MAG: YebC/PmpR family DNA-binding transcriptional regulator [Planctomycetota bacterium]
MGRQWMHAGRVANANKRGALISKMVKEVQVAARSGDPNPATNARLAAAIESARKNSVPRDTIERAIKKGAGIGDEQVHYELITYEGFAPHKVPVIVECLTDNKHRTASEVRVLFKKGQIGAPGSVTWMFDHVGVVEATHSNPDQDIEAVAIEAGAQNVEALEKEEVAEGQLGARFICERTDLDAVSKYLAKNGWTVTAFEMRYLAKNEVDLPPDQHKEVADFLHAIHDHEDVHRVYAALK